MKVHETGDGNWLKAVQGDENESPKLYWAVIEEEYLVAFEAFQGFHARVIADHGVSSSAMA